MSYRTATAAAAASKLEIDALLARITAASADHFSVDADTANWGHAGTLAHIAGLLREAADIADQSGEYAA